MGTPCSAKAQEMARRRLLTHLLPRLQHDALAGHVIMESRGGSDKWDTRTINRLRRSRYLTADLRVDHIPKADAPLLWIPDFLVGSWLASQHHDEAEPWQILAGAHTINVSVQR